MAETTDTNSLENRFTSLEMRVDALESLVNSVPTDSTTSKSSGTDTKFWAIEKIQEANHPQGSVLFAGVVSLPSGEAVSYQWQRTTEYFTEVDWQANIQRLSSLAHPVRGQILRRLLDAPASVQDLVTEDIVSSTGTGYHHCGELEKAGWIMKSTRSTFQLTPSRIIALLTIISAAEAH